MTISDFERTSGWGRARFQGRTVYAAWKGGSYVELFWVSQDANPDRTAFEVINIRDYSDDSLDPRAQKPGGIAAILVEWGTALEDGAIETYWENT